jgi:hypothetical protein
MCIRYLVCLILGGPVKIHVDSQKFAAHSLSNSVFSDNSSYNVEASEFCKFIIIQHIGPFLCIISTYTITTIDTCVGQN